MDDFDFVAKMTYESSNLKKKRDGKWRMKMKIVMVFGNANIHIDLCAWALFCDISATFTST